MSEDQGNELTEEVKELSLEEQENGDETEIKKDTVDGDIENEREEEQKKEDADELENKQEEEKEEEVEEEEVDEEDDDDEFGAFSDASFDEFEQPPEPESPKQEESISTPETNNTHLKLPQDLFDEPEMFQTRVQELLNQSFPEELPPASVPSNTDVLNERSRLLLERLVALPYLKPYSWKKSSLRRQLLQTLGIDSEKDQIRRKNLDDGSNYKIPDFESLNISDEEAKKYRENTDEILNKFQESIKEDDELTNLDQETLNKVVLEYKEQIKELKKLLSIWEYEQKNLEIDNETFEGVVENLVGHTQRLRREETMKSLKKESRKSKGLSMFKKKSKK
ncbi:putative membrane protein [Wickerhamomyces ciferrii]|uniref:Membrane protein n=1 Tax=Wickerhamomyces ciferrii (strain ATCC 14091 / BCRC 22168 / CBS 111 / JCM 3599 / NBRC 0793 / NRRL Y-1031 F-60-10) TaxID=1206466 RepID=K0KNC9_WICCF|nr:uncharacterized protein BN7_4060 [Wickerhamomyces ciferrii]CCH44496.1 putative membrane protein [Wickerhamomyces ciferrii]